MKCHYEILGVPTDVDSETLKKSYRKLALQWHPDKNLENVDEATETFRFIQQAYDVLSDPQERAWYDKHKEVILKGGLGSGDYNDNSLNVFQYFSASCYNGYNDDENGFYKVYGEVFSTIAAEDMEFSNNKESDFEIPTFGISTSSYEEVVHPFYAYWLSYCTLKSFVWVEKYDTREAPNRRVSRLMEKDNKKLRDQARKKRNEEVRTLVSFVRKRDKRVQVYKQLLEEKAVENAKKSEEIRKRQLQERQKNLENYSESGWSAMSTLESDMQKIEESLDHEYGDSASDISNVKDSDSDVENDDLYCMVCEKRFKNVRGLENHMKSRKHKDNLELLKKFMEEEDHEHFSSEDIVSHQDSVKLTEEVLNSDTENEKPDTDNIDKLNFDTISIEETIEENISKKNSRSKKRNKKALKNKTLDEDFDNDKSENTLLQTLTIDPETSSIPTCHENTARLSIKNAMKKYSSVQNVIMNFQREINYLGHIKSSGHSVYVANVSSAKDVNHHSDNVEVKKKSRKKN
ncbi:DnaJ subfamily C member 21 [Nymphon striatum]|nr:DnaJ subfamily C member 21 [Nymphon striatum]